MLAQPIAPSLSATIPAPYSGAIFASQGTDYGLTLSLKAAQTTGKTLTVAGITSQTGALQNWQDSGGNLLATLVPGPASLLTLDHMLGQTLAAAGNTYALLVNRHGDSGSFAQTAPMLRLNDAMTVSAGGANTANLLEIAQAGTIRAAWDHLGTQKTGSIAPVIGFAKIGLSSVSSFAASTNLSATGGVLTNGATYRYAITTLAANGAEGAPAEIIVNVPAGGTGTSGSVTLNWNGTNSAVNGYKLYRTAAGGVTGTWTDLVGTFAQGTLTVNDTGAATPGTAPLVTASGMASGFDTVAPASFLVMRSVASANRGALTIYGADSVTAGFAAPIDGAATGHFVGSASGTSLAINERVTFAGNFIHAQVLGVDRFILSGPGLVTQTPTDAVTNAVTYGWTSYHKTSGTPAVGFGAGKRWKLDDSANVARDASSIETSWTVATSTSQTAQMAFRLTSAGAALATFATLTPNGWLAPIAVVSDAGTNTVPTLATFYHKSSATPAASFGGTLLLTGDDNGATNKSMASLVSSWVVATDTTQTARLTLNAFDTAARECIRLEGSGTVAKVGFLGAAAVVRPTLAAAGSDAGTTLTLANSLRSALIALGLGV